MRFADDRSLVQSIDLHIDLRYIDDHLIPHSFGSGPDHDSGLLLPLMRLDRHRHTAIEVLDGTGAQIARLNRDEERRLIADGITHQTLGADHPDFPEIHRAIHAYIDSAAPVTERPPNSPIVARFLQLVRWLVRSLTALLPVHDSESPSSDRKPLTPREAIVARLAELDVSSDKLIRLLEDLDEYRAVHLLIADVPVQHSLPTGFVMTLRYTASVPIKKRSPVLILRRLIAGSLSWGTEIPIRAVGSSGSRHINVWAPRGFKVIDSGLVARREIGHLHWNTWHFDDDRLPIAAHVVVTSKDFRYATEPKFCVNFYSNKSGFFLESWLLSVAVALGILAFTIHLQYTEFDTSAKSTSSIIDSNFAATLLLLFPAIAVTIGGQRDEHRLASRTFALTRFFLFSMGIASAMCSLPFVFEMEASDARPVWYTGAWICFLVAIRLTVGGVNHLWRLSRTSDRWRNLRRKIERAKMPGVLQELGPEMVGDRV